MWISLFFQVTNDGAGGNGLELYQGSLDWILRKLSSLMGQASEQVAQGSGGILNPWACSEDVWMWHLGLWFTAKCVPS